VILELKKNLDYGCSSNDGADCYAPVVSSDNWSRNYYRPTLSFLESFDLLANHVGNGAGIRIQNVTWGDDEFVSSWVTASPLEVGFIGSRDSISTRSNSYSNGEATVLGFQDQAAFGFYVDNITNADLYPPKRISDTDGRLGHIYAGLEKKNKNNPEHKQIQRQRSQKGSKAVSVKVEPCNQEINHNYHPSAYQSGKRSVLEILHKASLTEEEAG